MPDIIKYDEEQINAIKEAVKEGHQSWSDKNFKEVKTLKVVKDKIKDFHIQTTDERCCYCGSNIHNFHRITLDIEHILPKSIFPQYMFTTKNLSIACKRCNMTIKGTKINFLTSDFNAKHIFRSKYYKFIHPNLDNYDAHLLLDTHQLGRKIMIKYRVQGNSNKGSYTYNYFKLSALEKNSFDKAQGGSQRHEVKNPDIKDIYEGIKY
ncbi:MAG: hypothetical protein WCR78_03265 [Arcobacteraceae bacterium]|jgi:5-methylcytosine-specific restriction endonuclease McrA